jgi:hypothetical protein
MSRQCLLSFALTVGVLGAATPAVAQPAGLPRIVINVDAGIQPQATTFSGATAEPIYLETASFTSDYRVGSGAMVDTGAALGLTKRIGVGVTVSWFSRADTADVNGTVPHPFFYGQLRPLSGTVDAGTRREINTHLNALFMVPLRSRVRLIVEGGPTWFSVRQPLIDHVAFTESYPYDTATFASAGSSQASDTHVGFNVGADISIPLAKAFGVGGIARYAHARTTLTTATGASVTADLGGLQVGGGIRLAF